MDARPGSPSLKKDETMNPQNIGRGQFRVKIRSERKRARLRRIPGVEVFPDGRVVFHIENLGAVLLVVVPKKRGKKR